MKKQYHTKKIRFMFYTLDYATSSELLKEFMKIGKKCNVEIKKYKFSPFTCIEYSWIKIKYETLEQLINFQYEIFKNLKLSSLTI